MTLTSKPASSKHEKSKPSTLLMLRIRRDSAFSSLGAKLRIRKSKLRG